MDGAHATAVLIIVPVDNLMATVFNTPATSVGGKNTLDIGLLRALTGDAIADVATVFTNSFVRNFYFDNK